jgi:hypothetical protein
MGNKASREDDDEDKEKKEEKPMSIKDHKKALVSLAIARRRRNTLLRTLHNVLILHCVILRPCWLLQENKKAARKLRVTDLEKKWHKAQAMTVKSPGSSPSGSKK